MMRKIFAKHHYRWSVVKRLSLYSFKYNYSKDLNNIPHTFSVGKIPPELLQKYVFPNLGNLKNDKQVLVGPKSGEDSAVIKMKRGDKIAIASDPITGSINQIGRLIVHVNANDVSCAGAKPKWLILTILLPKGTHESTLETIMKQVSETAESLGISIIGGHTEVTAAVNQPICVGTMFGELVSDHVIKNSNAKIGDRIILTKGVGIEGTSILSCERREILHKMGYFELNELDEISKKYENQLSVVKDAMIAMETVPHAIHCMHDPTEGGIAGAIHEVADASSIGFRINLEKIPISKETKKICEIFEISPFSLIGSGALLLCVDKSYANILLEKYKEMNIVASDIGEIVNENVREILIEGKYYPFKRPPQDSLWDALNKKFNV